MTMTTTTNDGNDDVDDSENNDDFLRASKCVPYRVQVKDLYPALRRSWKLLMKEKLIVMWQSQVRLLVLNLNSRMVDIYLL